MRVRGEPAAPVGATAHGRVQRASDPRKRPRWGSAAPMPRPAGRVRGHRMPQGARSASVGTQNACVEKDGGKSPHSARGRRSRGNVSARPRSGVWGPRPPSLPLPRAVRLLGSFARGLSCIATRRAAPPSKGGFGFENFGTWRGGKAARSAYYDPSPLFVLCANARLVSTCNHP